MLCALILYMSCGTYSLKSIAKTDFSEAFFMAILFTLTVLPKKYFHIFVLMSDLGFELGPYV